MPDLTPPDQYLWVLWFSSESAGGGTSSSDSSEPSDEEEIRRLWAKRQKQTCGYSRAV